MLRRALISVGVRAGVSADAELHGASELRVTDEIGHLIERGEVRRCQIGQTG
jgi:hypothetical protein